MGNIEYNDFGTLIKAFRKLVNISQEDFSKVLLCSKGCVAKIERTADVSELSLDILFRLYYVFSGFNNPDNYDKLIVYYAINVLGILDNQICIRINNRNNGEYVR